MRYFFQVLVAEGYKQHRIYFHGKVIYFSMLVWPMIELLIAYYMFSPFIDGQTDLPGLRNYLGGGSLKVYLLIGFLGYNFFFSLVQSASRFMDERYDGTLEIIMITPANRFAIILGNAFSALLEATWVLASFGLIAMLVLAQNLPRINYAMLPLAFLFLMFSATAWGTFLNSFFLMTRDVGLFFVLFQDPLSFFSGVRFPVEVLTRWMKTVSYALPLTYCLSILRKVILSGAGLQDVSQELLILSAIIAAMLIASYILIGLAEKHAKKYGSLTLF